MHAQLQDRMCRNVFFIFCLTYSFRRPGDCKVNLQVSGTSGILHVVTFDLRHNHRVVLPVNPLQHQLCSSQMPTPKKKAAVTIQDELPSPSPMSQLPGHIKLECVLREDPESPGKIKNELIIGKLNELAPILMELKQLLQVCPKPLLRMRCDQLCDLIDRWKKEDGENDRLDNLPLIFLLQNHRVMENK